jgi:hypothetical protein
VVAIHDYLGGFGAGSGQALSDPGRASPAVLFPELHFFTNDMWAVVRGVAGAKGFPLLLMNRYSKGIFYVLTVPENPADLYNLPVGVTSAIKSYLLPDFPVRLDSPAQVALFAYDNGAFVVESFRPDDAEVTVSVLGANTSVTNALTGEALKEVPAPVSNDRRRPAGTPRATYEVTVPPHSYLVFRTAPR